MDLMVSVIRKRFLQGKEKDQTVEKKQSMGVVTVKLIT
jgi:hypothetical protein